MSSHEEAAPGTAGDDSSGSPYHFVNQLRFVLTLSAVRFELTRLGPRLPPVRGWRFVTSPDHLLIMQHGFVAAVEGYRARYGDIRATYFDPDTVTFDQGQRRG